MLNLHDKISAICPIDGVSIGDPQNKSTWRVDYSQGATPQQIAAAQAVVAAFDPSAPTSADVNAERDRRIESFIFNGKSFNFVDGHGSDVNIAGAGTLALAAIIAGAAPGNLRWANPARDFSWVAADNTSVTMDAQTCLAFAQAAASWKANHIYAARTIKDAIPIPADYASNARWPT